MKITEILQAYHGMPACDRLDLICRMLRHCIPFEVRFLGTILLDEARSHFKTYISKIEGNANRVNYYSTMKDMGLTHEVCEKLCCALAVLHSDNRPVAEIIFGMLNDARVMVHFEEANDLRVMQDFRLLYVMAVNHPALSFNQRQHLMYTYLQRMDSVFIEKCKYSFSGSFSNSMEKTLSCEVDSGKYPPEGHFKEISPDAYIVRCDVHSVYKRTTDKRYAYMIQVEWSDGVSYTVRRTYGDFFSFQTKLLDLFPEEGGQKGKKHPRLIPYLPGKNYSKFLKNRDVAEKRLPELHRYSRELISLPDHVTRSMHVLEFFKPKATDMKEDYPAFHKITTLYDLIESGKVRSRVLSEPLKGSPNNSPIPHRSSPLNRAMYNASSSSTSSVTTPTVATTVMADSSRSSHTLPPAPSTSTQQVTHEVTPIISRRPTYPLSRQLQKSETSAFTPVGHTQLSEDDLTSTTTLTASVMSIPGTGVGPNMIMPTLSQTTPTLSQATPTSSQATPTATVDPITANSFVFAGSTTTSEAISKFTSPSTSHETTSSNFSISSSSDRALLSSTTVSSSTKEGVVNHTHPDPGGGVVSPGVATGGEMTSAQQMMALCRQIQMSQVVNVTSGGVVIPPLSPAAISPTQHISSPTSNSPLLTTTFSPPLAPPMASPSPTHSGASTPRGCGVGGTYPQPVLYPPYSPIYFISGSPLPSPLASPKTSSKWRGSYSSMSNQGMGDCDSLLKWLKSLRLHKYHSKFEKLTYDEMCQMTMEDLEARGMTTGAAKKLYKKLDELKKMNFAGFRDMPFASGMTRKLSTCSLPAALLMEQGMTPSSSMDQFSPTGSTCSLDHSLALVGGGIRTLNSSSAAAPHHQQQQRGKNRNHNHSNSVSEAIPFSAMPTSTASHIVANGTLGGGRREGAKLVDSAIVKAITSPPTTTTGEGGANSTPTVSRSMNSSSSDSAGNFSDPSISSSTLSSSHNSSHPVGDGASPVGSKAPPQSAKSTAGEGRESPSSPPSWADSSYEANASKVNRPDWARMNSTESIPTSSSAAPTSSVTASTTTHVSAGKAQSHSGTTPVVSGSLPSSTAGSGHISHSDTIAAGSGQVQSHSGSAVSGSRHSTSNSSSNNSIRQGNLHQPHTGTRPVSAITGTVSPVSLQHQQQHHQSHTSRVASGPSPHLFHHAHPRDVGGAVRGSSHPSHHPSPHSVEPSIVIPQPLHPNAPGRTQAGVTNWNKNVRSPYLPSTAVTLVNLQRPLHYSGHAHPPNQATNGSSGPIMNVNGIMRALTPSGGGGGGGGRGMHGAGIHVFPQGGGMVSYSGKGTPPHHHHTHHQPHHTHHHHHHHTHQTPHPVMCYNCGKRGHHGNTCPGVTMDAEDTTSFHKKLSLMTGGQPAA